MTSDEDLDRPLAGMLVLDFSQFLAGPVAALRLADLGARVVKIERPGVGELGRRLAFAGLAVDGDTVSFHAMNRGKQSFAADLKDPSDLAEVKRLVERADVIVQNFRPGVMARLGLDYATVRELNPRLVYGSVTGYGDTGPWKDKPGQDLLAQALGALPWLNGAGGDGPVPVGLSLADLLASVHLAHGVTALLLRRERTGRGGLVETSLMEGILDLQLELLAARMFDPELTVRRGGAHSASPFLPAPYGVYPTSDGYLALAMNPVTRIGELLGSPRLASYTEPSSWWDARDEIAELLATLLATETTRHWLDILEPADVWCAPVLTLPELVEHDGFAALGMIQQVVRQPGGPGDPPITLATTRSPLRIDGRPLSCRTGAPRVGEHNDLIRDELIRPEG